MEWAIKDAGKNANPLFTEKTVGEIFCAEELGKDGDCPKELKPGMPGYVQYRVWLIDAKTKKA